MSNTPTLHQITLPRLSAKFLCDALESPGWAANSDHGAVYQLIGADEPILPPQPFPPALRDVQSQTAARALDAAWCDAPVEFSVTDRQRDTIRKALRAPTEKHLIPPGRYTYKLLEAFALVSEG